jgi:hypothetical protein
MKKELEKHREDPSTMFRDLGMEHVQIAGRLLVQSELAGRMMAKKREEHETTWKDVEPDDFNPTHEADWLEDLGRDKKAMADRMWREGDELLAEQKDLGPSLMGAGFVKGMENAFKKYIDGYVTWMEHEANKKPPLNNDADAGLGTAAYVSRCMQTMGTEPTSDELNEAKEEMQLKRNWIRAEWKDQQFAPLEDGFVGTLQTNAHTPSKDDQQNADTSDANAAPEKLSTGTGSVQEENSQQQSSENRKAGRKNVGSTSTGSAKRKEAPQSRPKSASGDVAGSKVGSRSAESGKRKQQEDNLNARIGGLKRTPQKKRKRRPISMHPGAT